MTDGKYSAEAFFSAERHGRKDGCANMTLEETCALMTSADYKERFTAEYWQLRERLRKLAELLNKWDAGTLDFIPTCPREILDEQYAVMDKYLSILFKRAEIEGVSLK